MTDQSVIVNAFRENVCRPEAFLPAFAASLGAHRFAISRRKCPSLLLYFRPLGNRGRRENRMPVAPMGPATKSTGPQA
jgi:hypothetical protein